VNGEVHQTGRYLGDRAIYTCGHGWEIVGAEERVCQANGAWSNQEPYCKKRGKIRRYIILDTWKIVRDNITILNYRFHFK